MTKESFMIEEISKDIVLLLMKEHGMSEHAGGNTCAIYV